MNDHWNPVRRELTEFRRYLAPKLPELAVEHAFDFISLAADWEWGRERGMWKERGVYLIYDDDPKLLYVGKADGTFDRRLKVQAQKHGASEVAIIIVPIRFAFITPALESFLIARMQPPLNTCGKDLWIPDLPSDW